jgi:chromosome segregation ATPase
MRFTDILAKLVSTPEVLHLRAELARLHQRVDEMERSVDERLLALKFELHAEIKRLELRVQEMERQSKVLRLRVEATERELRKLAGVQNHFGPSEEKMGLA